MHADRAAILAEVAEMLHAIRDHAGVDGEITMSTRFEADLEMESIDVVSLAGRLQVRYGDTVNFAQFIAGLDLDSVRHLSVGQLVDYIADALDTAAAGAGDNGAGLGKVGTPA
jgi:acyl carrier protein